MFFPKDKGDGDKVEQKNKTARKNYKYGPRPPRGY